MTLLFAAIVVALIAAGAVIYPIAFGRWGLLGDPTPGRILEREARKKAALAALKEAQYDHAAGKLDEADYAAMRSQLEREALTAIHAVEQEEASMGSGSSIVHACGFTNPGGSRFCAGCGHRLG